LLSMTRGKSYSAVLPYVTDEAPRLASHLTSHNILHHFCLLKESDNNFSWYNNYPYIFKSISRLPLLLFSNLYPRNRSNIFESRPVTVTSNIGTSWLPCEWSVRAFEQAKMASSIHSFPFVAIELVLLKELF
jgi:hypothetical protein